MIHDSTEAGGWAKRRAERTEAIVAAGLRLVAANGLDALTVGRLSAEVGMTPGALYRYFPSKDAILAELNHRVVSRWSARFLAVQAGFDATDGPLPRLASVGLAFAALAVLEPEALALVALTTADPRVLVPDPEPRHIPPMLALLTQVGLLIDAAELGPGRDRATTLLFGLLGVLQTGKLNRFDPVFAPQRLARTLVSDLLIGWGAPPDAAAAAVARASHVVTLTLEPA